jgi:hypothetical protein
MRIRAFGEEEFFFEAEMRSIVQDPERPRDAPRQVEHTDPVERSRHNHLSSLVDRSIRADP